MSIYHKVIKGKYAASTVSLEDGDVARIDCVAKVEFNRIQQHFMQKILDI